MSASPPPIVPGQPRPLWFEVDLSFVGLLGFAGNLFWFLRFFQQWLVSERRKESVIPVMFWYWSLLGTVCLGLYFVLTHNLPGTLAYLPNAFVYVRNLMLIRRKRLLQAGPGAAAEPPPAAPGAGAPLRGSGRLPLVPILITGAVCTAAGIAIGILLAGPPQGGSR